MSPLLIVGIVLLVVVAGLSLLQRARQRDFSGGATGSRASGNAAPDASWDPSNDPDWPFRTDPYWGELTWDRESRWEADGAMPMADDHVTVVVFAGREGPGAQHREWYEAARAQGSALVGRATAMLVSELAARGVDHDTLSLSEVQIGAPTAQAPFQGRREFDADHEAIEWCDVRSIDMWRTLEADVAVIDPADLAEADEDA